jgi:hypothetical protein
MRRAARTDDNKAAIVSALRALGCSVYDLRMPVDLLVGRNGRTMLVEIKDGNKSPSKRAYTPAQQAFLADWRGAPIVTVLCVDDAINAAQSL